MTAGKPRKRRADELLAERGMAADRQEAAKLIMAGMVRTGPDALLKKPSDEIPEDSPLFVDEPSPYVSRGAYKLLEALERLLPSLEGLAALDIGASTGGFSDLMLQKGARKVYATDVGKGQLHIKLRKDPRVAVLEGIHMRQLSKEHVPEQVDVVCVDVSFISVTKALEPADAFLKPGGWAFILVKPQFEVEKREAPGGVVSDEAVRARCVEKAKSFAKELLKWDFVEARPCPIKGPKGNQEFMAVFRKPAT